METRLTFNQFLEEYADKTKDKTLRGFFLLNLGDVPNAFQDLSKAFTGYSEKWAAEFVSGREEDFYIVVLKSLEDKKDHFFFIKEMVRQSKYFVFTYEEPVAVEQFNRLLYSGKALWKPWLGSRFLENFNQFIHHFYPTSSTELVSFSTEYREVESKKKKGSGRFWIVRNKEELLKIREFQYKTFGELSYIKRGKWKISNNGNTLTTISLSDRGEFSIKGDLLEFLDLGKGILDYSEHLKDLLLSKLNFSKIVEKMQDQTVQTVSLESLKVIDVNMSTALLENWFDNLLKIHEIGYLSEYRVMVFEKAREESYFIIEIVDIETGNKVYLSSDKQRITLAPGLDCAPEPETISKILSMLQARVDPSITLGEDYG